MQTYAQHAVEAARSRETARALAGISDAYGEDARIHREAEAAATEALQRLRERGDPGETAQGAALRDTVVEEHGAASAIERTERQVAQAALQYGRNAQAHDEAMDDIAAEMRGDGNDSDLNAAKAAAERAVERDRAARRKQSAPHRRRKALNERAKERLKESKLDKKRKRKLSSADYAAWRAQQDAKEEAKDAPARRSLEARATANEAAAKRIASLERQDEQQGGLDGPQKKELRELKALERETRLTPSEEKELEVLAQRAAAREEAAKTRPAPPIPSRYDRERTSKKQLRSYRKDAALDKKNRRKLSPQAYVVWRQQQDEEEAARDEQRRAELEGRQEDPGLTPAEERELEAIAQRAEERDDRAGRDPGDPPQAAPMGPVWPPPQPPDAPPVPVGPQQPGPAAKVPADTGLPDSPTQPPDPCADCTCDPPCKPGEVCICVPITGPTVPANTQPPNGGVGNGPSGPGPQIPEGVWLSPDPTEQLPASPQDEPTKTEPGSSRAEDREPESQGPVRHPPLARGETRTVPSPLCRRAVALIIQLVERLGTLTDLIHDALDNLEDAAEGAGELERKLPRRVVKARQLRSEKQVLPTEDGGTIERHIGRGLYRPDIPGSPIRSAAALARDRWGTPFLLRAAEMRNALRELQEDAESILDIGANPADCRLILVAVQELEAQLVHMHRWATLLALYSDLEVLAQSVLGVFGPLGQYADYSEEWYRRLLPGIQGIAEELDKLASPEFAQRIDGNDPTAFEYVTHFDARPQRLIESVTRSVRRVAVAFDRLDELVKAGGELLILGTLIFAEVVAPTALREGIRGFPLRLKPRAKPPRRRYSRRFQKEIKARQRARGDTQSKRSPLQRRIPPRSRRRPEDWPADEAASRVDDLARQGHGPQRHEGQVGRAEHDARVLDGIDPATGQSLPYTPQKSSSFRSNEAYAQAEMRARQSQEFLSGAAEQKNLVKVERLSLEDALGPNYRRHVEGRTTVGASLRSTRATDFAGGHVTAIYRRNSTGGYDLVTMYPNGS